MTLDPIHQFNIDNLFTIGHIGGHTIAFTNSSLYMLLTVAVICLLIGSRLCRAGNWFPAVSSRPAELSYVFVANMIRSTAGEEGMKFFPLVYSLFMFILVANVISIIPYTFSITSHIIVTAAFALLVFFTVLVYGFYKNGLKFFRIFVPQGVPIYILPLVVIDRDHLLPVAAAFAQRPSVRQHAGRSYHAEGIRRLRRHARHSRSARSAGLAACVPLAMTVALTALELLIAFLQAYVFAILTCIYLNDALHAGH